MLMVVLLLLPLLLVAVIVTLPSVERCLVAPDR